MKRLHVLGLFAVLAPAALAHAEMIYIAPAPPPSHLVLADLGLHVIGAGFQTTVSPHLALQLDADFYGPWTQSLANDHGAAATAGGVIRVRPFFYLTRAALRGVWVSPFVQAGFAKGDVDHAVGLAAAGGVSVGYAWLFPHDIALAIGVGVQYHYADTNPGFSSVWPHADFNIGYAF
jgi:hypothetical protein